jgi:hypothetical protein
MRMMQMIVEPPAVPTPIPTSSAVDKPSSPPLPEVTSCVLGEEVPVPSSAVEELLVVIWDVVISLVTVEVTSTVVSALRTTVLDLIAVVVESTVSV